MKNVRIATMTLASVGVALAFGGAALAGAASRTVAFNGTYKGQAAEKVNGNTVTATAKGSGIATLVGKSTISGSVVATTTADQPCAPFGGPGYIIGKSGKLKVTVLPASRGCAASQEEKDSISLAGTVKVKGGTAKFRTAHGTLRFTGHYDRASGAFTVKLKGTLSL